MKGLEISEIKFKDIALDGDDFRLDSEFFMKKFINSKLILKKIKSSSISTYSKISDGDHSAFPENQKNEIRYLQAKDIKNHFIIDESPVFISKEYFDKNTRSHIKEENVILSIMGSVGDIAITPKGFIPTLANRAVAIIKEINGINPYYIFIYLSSKFGQAQIERQKTGGVQVRINLDVLSEIQIPSLSNEFQNKIGNLVKLAHENLRVSKNCYTEAENILYWELGLSYLSKDATDTYQYLLQMEVTPPTVEELLSGERILMPDAADKAIYIMQEIESLNQPKNYTPNNYLKIQELEKEAKKEIQKWDKHKDLIREFINKLEQHNVGLANINKYQIAKQQNHNTKTLKDSFLQSGRLDAEYYQPKYDELEKIIKNYKGGYSTIGESTFEINTGDFCNDYKQKSAGLKFYIRNTNITKGRITDDENYYIETSGIKKFVNEGDILTARVGAIGSFGTVTKEFKGAVYSDNVLCLRLKENLIPEVYTFYFNSKLNRDLMEKISGGSVQPLITQTSIKEILIPLFDNKIQNNISEKVQESFALQSKSKQLLEVAKLAVEIAIEQGEKVALSYLKKIRNTL